MVAVHLGTGGTLTAASCVGGCVGELLVALNTYTKPLALAEAAGLVT